jgi:hypothetical protein
LGHQPSLPVNCEGRRAIASRARRDAMADLHCLCGATARQVLSASDASFGSASQASSIDYAKDVAPSRCKATRRRTPFLSLWSHCWQATWKAS